MPASVPLVVPRPFWQQAAKMFLINLTEGRHAIARETKPATPAILHLNAREAWESGARKLLIVGARRILFNFSITDLDQ